MEIGKWKLAQAWRHFKRPASSKGLWKQFVDASKERDQRAEVITYDFDELSPREEQYYQKPPFSTNEVFLGSKGGTPQLVQPGPGRPGYADGPPAGTDVFKITARYHPHFGEWRYRDRNKKTKYSKTKPITLSRQEVGDLLADTSKWLKGYSFDSLLKDLRNGKTPNQIAQDLYAKNKFYYDSLPLPARKPSPVGWISSALSKRIKRAPRNAKEAARNKMLQNLVDKNVKAFENQKKSIVKDIKNFISTNKAKYKKMFEGPTAANATQKFYDDLIKLVEKKYPRFIKKSPGNLTEHIMKGTKYIDGFAQTMGDIKNIDVQAGERGHVFELKRLVWDALGIDTDLSGETSRAKYISRIEKLLPLAQDKKIIPYHYGKNKTKIKDASSYFNYLKKVETGPMKKVFGNLVQFSAEHPGGVSRAAELLDSGSLGKVTSLYKPYAGISPDNPNVIKGIEYDTRISNLVKHAHRNPLKAKEFLSKANRISKEAAHKFGVLQTLYSLKDGKIISKHPNISLEDSFLAKTKRAIHGFIANNGMQSKVFKKLPIKLQQGIKLINNGENANKILSSHLTDVIPNWKSNKGVMLPSFAGAIPVDNLPSGVTEALGKTMNALSKSLKVLGIASLPADVVPFAQQMERGLGTRSLDTGAMRWMEDVINMPKSVAQLFGKDLPYEERTFGRKYADKVAGEIGEEKITANIDQLFAGSEKIDDPMYDALGEYSFAARTDDRQKVKDKALTPFFEETETETEEVELPSWAKRAVGEPQLEFAEGGTVPRTGYKKAGLAGTAGLVGRSILGKAFSWVGADIGFYYLDKWNEMSKGHSEEEAAAIAKDNATLGLYKNKEYIKQLKKTAEEMGLDSRAFENVYKINDKMAKVQKEHERYQGMIEKLEAIEGNPEKRDRAVATMKKRYDEWQESMDPEIDKWVQGVVDDISISKTGGIASPLELSKAAGSITEEEWQKPFIDIQDVALEKLEKEKAAAYDMQSKQVDPEAGNIGNILNIFPFSLSPIERAKEQGRINDMLDFDPKELYRYNIARGLDPDNPLTWEAYDTLKSAHPGLGFREEDAGGGIAGLLKK